LAQQACADPPQAPQLPLPQVPPSVGQVLPELVHRSLTQQPPPLHALPAQQASPGPPQGAQTSLLQTLPLAQPRPVQHG
jgi:hypothetical protein